MTIDQYRQELESHDWFYEFSDSHQVWKKGEANESRLKTIAFQNGVDYMEIFDAVWLKKFSRLGADVTPPMLAMCGGSYKSVA